MKDRLLWEKPRKSQKFLRKNLKKRAHGPDINRFRNELIASYLGVASYSLICNNFFSDNSLL